MSVLSGGYYDWKQYTVFYVWKMREEEKKTTIFVETYGEAEFVEPLSQGDFSRYYDEEDRNWHRSWSEAFVSLRKIVDANAG